MHELKIFDYGGSEVRTIAIGGEPWFVLKDVCEILGIKNVTDVSKRLDEDERGRFNLGRQGGATIISESGLYSVILRSDKPEAKPFQRWVRKEVLPSIRKHGAYMTPETIEKSLNDPDFIIGIATQLKAHQEMVRTQSVVIEEMKPKVNYFNKAIERDGLMGFRDTAKALNVKEKAFVRWLLVKGYVYRAKSTSNKAGRLLPIAEYNNLYLKLVEPRPDAPKEVKSQTMVTARGRAHFSRLLDLEKQEEELENEETTIYHSM